LPAGAGVATAALGAGAGAAATLASTAVGLSAESLSHPNVPRMMSKRPKRIGASYSRRRAAARLDFATMTKG
jgi:hypothetical protein